MFSETTRANIRNVQNMVNFKIQTIYDSGSKFKLEFGSTFATRCKFVAALPKF